MHGHKDSFFFKVEFCVYIGEISSHNYGLCVRTINKSGSSSSRHDLKKLGRIVS